MRSGIMEEKKVSQGRLWMQKGGVKHVVHQHEFKLAVVDLTKKIGIEANAISIRIGMLDRIVEGKLHMHQQ